MKKIFKKIKLEFFYLRKAFFEYHQGFSYIYYKYIIAPKILKSKKVFEKPINNSDLSIHILTCHRDLIMTIWSLASLYHNTNISGQLIIHNDGSLTDLDKENLKKFFPSAKISETSKFLNNYTSLLSGFSILKNFRSEYSNFSFKKLIDPYFVSSTTLNLIVDSDLFWLKQPEEIEIQISNGGLKSMMQINNSVTNITFKSNFKIDDNLTKANAGIIFYNKNNFDLGRLEKFLDNLDVNNPKSLHFADQLGYAFCLNHLEFLPEISYSISGQITTEVSVKHYTSPRRPLFYIEGIKNLDSQYGFSKRN